MDEKNHNSLGARVAILITLFVVVATALLFVPPIAQWQSFYDFADKRAILGVPNFFDVMSNLAFAVVGAMGLWSILCGLGGLDRVERWAFGAVFGGALLTAFGSGWFHLWPSNESLVWDRLPMALTFGAFLAAMVAERVSPRAGAVLLLPFMIAGAATVIYWGLSERAGHGDLRPYFMVQGFSLAAMLYIGPAFRWRHIPTRDLLIALGWYALAMVLEELDKQVFGLSGGTLFSGHTIKHVAAAMGIYWLLRTLKKEAGNAVTVPKQSP